MTASPMEPLPNPCAAAAAMPADLCKKPPPSIVIFTSMGVHLCFFHCLKDLFYQLIPSVALFRGKGNHGAVIGKLQIPTNHFQIWRKLAFFQLVLLVGYHDKGAAGIQEPLGHGNIIVRGRMPIVHNQHTKMNPVGPKFRKIGVFSEPSHEVQKAAAGNENE